MLFLLRQTSLVLSRFTLRMFSYYISKQLKCWAVIPHLPEHGYTPTPRSSLRRDQRGPVKFVATPPALAPCHAEPLRSVAESSQDAAQTSPHAGQKPPHCCRGKPHAQGMSNPCPLPVIQTGRQSSAWEHGRIPGGQEQPGQEAEALPPSRSSRGSRTRAPRGRRGRAGRRPPS